MYCSIWKIFQGTKGSGDSHYCLWYGAIDVHIDVYYDGQGMVVIIVVWLMIHYVEYGLSKNHIIKKKIAICFISCYSTGI